MALRSPTPASEPTPADEPLGSAHSERAQPGTPEKRWTAAVAAAVIVVSMFLPWWHTAYPLRNEVDALNGWQMLGLGLGIGNWAPKTGFSGLGNVLWGAVPTIAGLVLVLLLVVRAVRPRALPANSIALWSVFTLLAQLWLVVLGWLRLNATMGVFPTLWGMLPATMAAMFSAVALWNWWFRGERRLWRAQASGAAGAVDADGEADAVDAGDAAAPDALAELLDDADADDAAASDAAASDMSAGAAAEPDARAELLDDADGDPRESR